MNSTDPYQKNHKNKDSQGGRETSFTITHVDKNAPEAICIDLISARNEAAANTVAKRQFPNSTILRIAANATSHPSADYPDARFIKGEFRLIHRPND